MSSHVRMSSRCFLLAFPYLCGSVIVALVALDATWWSPRGALERVPHHPVSIVSDAVAGEPGRIGAQPVSETDAEPLAGYAEGVPRAIEVGMAAAMAQKVPNSDARSGAGMSHGMAMHHGKGLRGIPVPIYYGSIAVVLLLSFLVIDVRGGHRRRGEEPESPRYDLLRLRWVRGLLAHRATRPVLQAFVVGWFVLIIATGLFGSQLPTKNIAPLLTWTVWWCGLVLLILYAGKAWCYVCPWDALAGWAEGGGKRTLGLEWPRALRNIWPATILFIALTWVELGFAVTMKPRATAWFGLAMLSLAFGSAFVFDRKSFCRYGCLVGRISGMYALFSPVEIRARDRQVCRSCASRACYRGSEAGQACPTFQYLGTMTQNTYCIACMECVKTCDHDNVALNLRPWAEDLRQVQRPRSDEAYLALLMVSLTGFHGLTMTGSWARMTDRLQGVLGVGEPVAFSLGMAAIILGPVLLYAALVALSRWVAGRPASSYGDHFIRYAYGLLPIALFYHLAHNSEHLMMEGQRIIALLSDPFGLEWNLFGTAQWSVQPLVHAQTLWAIQILLVLTGHVYSLWATHRVAGILYDSAHSVRRSQLAMLAAMVMFSVLSLWLLKQPMEMRMSWM